MKQQIESAFRAAIAQLSSGDNLASDLFVQVANGVTRIYDDSERQIAEVAAAPTTATLKTILQGLAAEDAFDAPGLIRPLSVSLTDENFGVLEELLFVDDEFIRLDDPLLKDLDAELDEFLAELLADMK